MKPSTIYPVVPIQIPTFLSLPNNVHRIRAVKFPKSYYPNERPLQQSALQNTRKRSLSDFQKAELRDALRHHARVHPGQRSGILHLSYDDTLQNTSPTANDPMNESYNIGNRSMYLNSSLGSNSFGGKTKINIELTDLMDDSDSDDISVEVAEDDLLNDEQKKKKKVVQQLARTYDHLKTNKQLSLLEDRRQKNVKVATQDLKQLIKYRQQSVSYAHVTEMPTIAIKKPQLDVIQTEKLEQIHPVMPTRLFHRPIIERRKPSLATSIYLDKDDHDSLYDLYNNDYD
ncbi:MAG: hypothetical protein EZS28_033796 [Streblomastix strix]|uniref:Uncharacterized protein n=1 Tax=Streblomastix strix TaxID=222440 RepID=A0A5J4UJQ4_9EUKA|nr:MAG: hypothetical protein EZS28_033796 [Streblomastix strix]